MREVCNFAAAAIRCGLNYTLLAMGLRVRHLHRLGHLGCAEADISFSLQGLTVLDDATCH